MTNSNDPIGITARFMHFLAQQPMSRYLEIEGFLAGGFRWRIKAWCAERSLAKNTAGVFEATGEEYESEYASWQDLVYQVRFGAPLTKKGRKATRKLVDAGIAESRIRTWIVNKHMDEDGNLAPHYRGRVDTLVRALGWTWHSLVAVSFSILIVLTWGQTGPLWTKLVVSVGIVVFFTVMSVLMNSTSLSALPPNRTESVR